MNTPQLVIEGVGTVSRVDVNELEKGALVFLNIGHPMAMPLSARLVGGSVSYEPRTYNRNASEMFAAHQRITLWFPKKSENE